MNDQIATVKFYYDYKSPFTYLAFAPAIALEDSYRARIRFIPYEVDLRDAYGGDLPQRTDRDWNKVRYLYADARRFATERGIVIRGPQKLFDSRLAMISGLYTDHHGRFRSYSEKVFERFFKRELDIEDAAALAAVMTECGIDASDFPRFAKAEGQAELAAAQAEGDADKVFGVPMMILEGEPFWGNDRVVWLAKKLDAMGLRKSANDAREATR